MSERELPKGPQDEWSQRQDTLRRRGEKQPGDDAARTENSTDFSAVGGPESEASYGRTRSDTGYFPRNAEGGPHDRDTRPTDERGGYLKKPRPDPQTRER